MGPNPNSTRETSKSVCGHLKNEGISTSLGKKNKDPVDQAAQEKYQQKDNGGSYLPFPGKK